MNTAGAVGTDGAWQIMFKPWGPSCWAAQRGSHSHSPPAPPHRLGGTWRSGGAGAFAGDFLLLPSRLAGSSVNARGGPFLGCLWGRRRVQGLGGC